MNIQKEFEKFWINFRPVRLAVDIESAKLIYIAGATLMSDRVKELEPKIKLDCKTCCKVEIAHSDRVKELESKLEQAVEIITKITSLEWTGTGSKTPYGETTFTKQWKELDTIFRQAEKFLESISNVNTHDLEIQALNKEKCFNCRSWNDFNNRCGNGTMSCHFLPKVENKSCDNCGNSKITDQEKWNTPTGFVCAGCFNLENDTAFNNWIPIESKEVENGNTTPLDTKPITSSGVKNDSI